MRLLDLIQQDDGIGPAPYRFGQVTALFVTDVARRRTDQACHRVFLHELGHIDAHHRFFGVEQEIGQRLGQFGLTDTGRPEEQE